MRKILVVAAAAVMVATLVAARPDDRPRPHPRAVAAVASITIDQPTPALGDVVTFTYETGPLEPSQDPRIQVECYQAGVLVWAHSAPAGEPVLLGGNMSDWFLIGGPASCAADLYYWTFVPVQEFHLLASTTFEALG